jgi:hypothetical protein
MPVRILYSDPATGLEVLLVSYASRPKIIIKLPVDEYNQFRAIQVTLEEWASINTAMVIIGQPVNDSPIADSNATHP